MTDLQAVFGSEGTGEWCFVVHRVTVDWPPERNNCQFQLWRCSVAGASGCEPHRDNDFVVSISNQNATGRTQPEDASCPSVAVERNTSEIGPRNSRDSILFVGASSSDRGFWKGSRLGGASFSRQNGSRCEHVDADGQNLAPAKISVRAAVLGDWYRY